MNAAVAIKRQDRVTLTTIERLSDAAGRYGISRADIMRRASVAYLNRMNRFGVVVLPKQESTTRQDSMPIEVCGLDERIDASLFGQIANWYLDLKDTGYRRPAPHIDSEDLLTPYLIEETT